MLLKMLCQQQALFSVQVSERVIILVEVERIGWGSGCLGYSGALKTAASYDSRLPETNSIACQALQCRGNFSDSTDWQENINKHVYV
jgi:hypothetical protein